MASWPSERRASCRASLGASTCGVPFSVLAWPWSLPWRVPPFQRPDHRRPNPISRRQSSGGGHSRASVRPSGPHWQPGDPTCHADNTQVNFSLYIYSINSLYYTCGRGCNKSVNYSCPARTSFPMSENCQGPRVMEVL